MSYLVDQAIGKHHRATGLTRDQILESLCRIVDGTDDHSRFRTPPEITTASVIWHIRQGNVAPCVGGWLNTVSSGELERALPPSHEDPATSQGTGPTPSSNGGAPKSNGVSVDLLPPKKEIAWHAPDDNGKLTAAMRLKGDRVLAEGLVSELGKKVPVSSIRPCPNQPRTEFDQEKLIELAGSIRAVGQLVPILVRPLKDAEHAYEIIDGERRWRACNILGLETVLVFEGNVTSFKEQFAVSAVANFGREGHTPLEFARTVRFVMRHFNCSIADAARIFGQHYQTVYRHYKILSLPDEVLAYMEKSDDGPPPLGLIQAVALAPFPEQYQLSWAKEIVRKRMDGQQARRYVRDMEVKHKIARTTGRMRKPSDHRNTIMQSLERMLRKARDINEFPASELAELARTHPKWKEGVEGLVLRILEELQKTANTLDGKG